MKCIIVDDDIMMRTALETLVNRSAHLQLSHSFNAANTALDYLRKNQPDVMFLDVEMPGMTGFELIGELGQQAPVVIMVTAHAKYAAGAFESNVVDFLVKPIAPVRFQKAVEKARMHANMRGLKKENPDSGLLVKTSEGLVKIPVEEILFVKSLADYVTIHTATNKFTTHFTLKAILERMEEKDFVRVHHSYIVRLDKIIELGNNALKIGTFNIPVSRAKRKALHQRFAEFFK
ncbi:MAG TPA: LytTR family DNA-binding domain-containing protein [Bacteroidia bacterium]|nr:LytTR family DNA-binding domain-containing protein [Bacteroidia bacterium]